MKRLCHFTGFQVAWFAIVLSAAGQTAAWGIATALILLVLHLAFFIATLPEFARLLTAATMGVLADSAVIALGAMRFPDGIDIGPPAWMPLLWIIFAATLAVTMSWIKGRLILAAILGAIFGPVCYFAGAKLGALEIAGEEQRAAAIIAMEWALAMPVLVVLTTLADSWHTDERVAPGEPKVNRK